MKITFILVLLPILVLASCGDGGEAEPEVKMGVLKRVTLNGGNYPQWSPDGTRLLFSRSDKLFTITPDGRDSLLVTTIQGGSIFHPHFNPADPNQLCFINRNAEAAEWEIYRLTIGGDPEKIYSQTKQISSISFTRDGGEIAFSKDPGSTSGVWLISTDDAEVSQWPRDDKWGIIADAECAVDADLISFIEKDANQAYNLFTLARNGGTPEQISSFPTGTDFTQAARSSDGSKYCIRWGQRIWYGTDFNLYIMDESGSEIEQVTTMARPFDPDHPAWSPDGNIIAFSRQPSGGEEDNLFIVDLTE